MFIYLPGGPHGEKVGVDDYLADGHSIDDLIALASPELRALESPDDDQAPYRSTASGIVWMKSTANGPIETRLTNFAAQIVSDIVEDDGAEERRFFEIEAQLLGRTLRFEVPTAYFANLTWVTERLGAAAICYPGFSVKDHARVAIQSLSPDIVERRVYAHTGWRKVDGHWTFLHGDGGIGAEGESGGIQVKLSGSLSRVSLPPPPGEPTPSVVASLRLFELGPVRVTAPLVGITYLAPLCELLGDERPDLTVWAHGRTGTFKSETGALFQSHFGSFDRKSLPASFMDTANAIERILFAAKDCLVVVDDFHPPNDRREDQAMSANASRLLRGSGNGTGRRRMRADTTLRTELPPRALVLATGERLPSGHSAGSRMFPVPVVPGDINKERLTAAQDVRGEYALAMSAFIRWVAGRFEDLREILPGRFRELRTAASVAKDAHPRDPAQVAHLQLGVETFLRFAAEVGAVSSSDAEQLREDAWSALLELSRSHQEAMAEESPVRIFLALLSDGFASRRAFVEALQSGPPPDALALGWEIVSYIDRNGDEQAECRHGPSATLLGHADAEWFYLVPETTMQFIATAARAADKLFPVDQSTLLRRLDENHLIATEEQGSRRVVNQRIQGSTRRVIKLKRSALSTYLSSDEAREQREQRERANGPDSTTARHRSQEAHPDGNTPSGQSDSNEAAVPAVPAVPGFEDVGEDWDVVRV